MKMSLTHCAMACGWHQPKGNEAVVSRQRTGGRGCRRNPRTTSALRLHSCRALSSAAVRQHCPRKPEHTNNTKSVTYVPGRKCYLCTGTFIVASHSGGIARSTPANIFQPSGLKTECSHSAVTKSFVVRATQDRDACPALRAVMPVGLSWKKERAARLAW